MQDFGPLVSTEPAERPSNERPLVGKYVRLEGLRKEHIPSLFSNFGLPQDKSVFDWLPWTDPANTEDELWTLYENLRKNRGFIIYAIKADPRHLNPHSTADSSRFEVLGSIGYLDVNPLHRVIEVGSVLFSRALRRSAAATEAIYLMIRNVCEPDESSSSPPYRRVAWQCNRLNTSSRRAAERIGYVYEGTMRKHRVSQGHSRDSDVLSIVDDEWPAVKEALETWLDAKNFDEEGEQIRTLEQIRAHTKK